MRAAQPLTLIRHLLVVLVLGIAACGSEAPPREEPLPSNLLAADFPDGSWIPVLGPYDVLRRDDYLRVRGGTMYTLNDYSLEVVLRTRVGVLTYYADDSNFSITVTRGSAMWTMPRRRDAGQLSFQSLTNSRAMATFQATVEPDAFSTARGVRALTIRNGRIEVALTQQ